MYPAPTVNFHTYSSAPNVITPVVPQTLSAYTMKSNFTKDEILSFAQKLGLTDFQSTNTHYDMVSNRTDVYHRGILVFDRLSGTFDYQSYADTTPTNYVSGMNPQEEAMAMLSQLGIADATVSCPITYQMKTTPSTYVECHRDWDKIGAPIYNPIGLLNIPENIPLSTLQVGEVNAQSPADHNIINVISNGISQPEATGKARPNDFNTLTVVVTPNGMIHEIDSKLRWIDSTKTQTFQPDKLLSPQVAQKRLENHLASFSLTIPSGSGVINWQSVYPNNQAFATNATITDEQLAYIEKPDDAVQTNFVPMYVFRGYTTLNSGYRVNFVQMVPAMTNLTTFLSENTAFNLSSSWTSLMDKMTTFFASVIPPVFAQTQNPNSLQLKTFQITPTVATTTASEILLTPTLIPSETYSNSGTVECNASGMTRGAITLNVPGVGTVLVQSDAKTPHSFNIVSRSVPINALAAIKDTFYKTVEQQYDINVAKYLVQNKSIYQYIKNTEDVKTLFFYINSGMISTGIASNAINPIPPGYGTCPVNIPYQRSAPLYNCASEGSGNVFLSSPQIASFVPEVEVNANNVANDIYAAIQNNQISIIAAKSDLFSSSTLTYLGWVFLKSNIGVSNTTISCHISGVSPALFLYPQNTKVVKVKSGATLTYTDPTVVNNTWKVTAQPNGHLQTNGMNRDELYYEYDPNSVHFTTPQQGYIVNKTDLVSFIKQLATKMGLNDNESTALLADVTRSAQTITTSEVKVSFVSPKELARYLPLTIFPSPDHIYRIQLLLEPVTTSQQLTAPILPKIMRAGFTVVEVGAREVN